MKYKDLTGEVFEDLTVLGLAEKTKNRSIRWTCKCACGKIAIISNSNLLSGAVVDCGCKTKKIDIVGQRFSRLYVINKIIKNRKTLYMCKCDCGNLCLVSKHYLTHGITKSCGCLKKEYQKKGNKKHGLLKTRIYRIYMSMKNRCYLKTHVGYNRYGGRGIKICDEWLGENGLRNFYNWAVTNGYDEHLSIDRIDNDGDYSPKNCKWSTPREQQNNTSKNRKFYYNGEWQSISELSRKYNINISTLYNRIKKHGNIIKAIEEPIDLKMSRTKKSGS